jgi:hypothetical protein
MYPKVAAFNQFLVGNNKEIQHQQTYASVDEHMPIRRVVLDRVA